MTQDCLEKVHNLLYRLVLHSRGQRWAKTIKREGEIKYPHQPSELTSETVENHLQGKNTIGVFLLQQGTNTTKAGCIDIDIPRDAKTLEEALGLAQRIQTAAKLTYRLETYVEFSGNRGYHVWLFLSQSVPGQTMIDAMREISLAGGFEPKEIFPSASLNEPKCIKLPCGIHPKSGEWCGFISDSNENMKATDNQAELMEGFVQNDPSAIADLLNLSKPAKQSQPVPDNPFKDFKPNEHPGCIKHLIENGANLAFDYNSNNLTLARYAVARNMSDSAAIELANVVAKKSENHHSSKTESGKVDNFKSVLSSAQSKDYKWQCSYILAGIQIKDKEAIKCRGCNGSACPVWPYCELKSNPNQSKKTEAIPLNRMLWEVFISLYLVRAEVTIGRLLTALINFSDEMPYHEVTDMDEATEREVIAYLLHNPDEIEKALQIEIPLSGFRTVTDQKPSDYIQELLAENPCNEDTFKFHLNRIRDLGLRAETSGFYHTAFKDVDDLTKPLEKTIQNTNRDSQKILRKQNSEIKPMETKTSDLLADLFSSRTAAIPTPSPDLNNLLNGGFGASKFIVVGAPPGTGKSTMLAWIADNAAANGYPVLFLSYEMPMIDLWQYSLSRIADINSRFIESRVWMNSKRPQDRAVREMVYQAAELYDQTIAKKMTIVECGPDHTAARIAGCIAQVRHDHQMSDTQPVLVIVDYLQLLFCGDEKLDGSGLETVRVSRIATQLKQLARDTNCPIVAISDITKEAYQKSISTGQLDLSALRDSFKIAHAADTVLLLQSGSIQIGKGQNKKTVNQLDLMVERDASLSTAVSQAEVSYPLNPDSKDTYARLTILKNRGGRLGEPCFIYHKAFHKFTPMDLRLDLVQCSSKDQGALDDVTDSF